MMSLNVFVSVAHLEKCDFKKGVLNSHALMAHTFNPGPQEHRQVDLTEFEVSLVYRVSSKTGLCQQTLVISIAL